MKSTRRNFLKVAGVTALGLAAGAGSALAASSKGAYLPHYEHMTPFEGEGHDPRKAKKASRWGMLIDTRAFHDKHDYDPLIKACHEVHNVPDFSELPGMQGKQDIKWLWTGGFHEVFPHDYQENEFMSEDVHHRTFPLLCNHCQNPPCVRVCPTQATFKRKDGIVIMDMHRCIGCRFCMAGCPYGSRSFNFRDPRLGFPEGEPNPKYPTRTKGVVEKCNFCAERLAEGLEPACVEASGGKLIFGDLGDPESEIRHALAENYTIRRKPDLGTSPSVFYII